VRRSETPFPTDDTFAGPLRTKPLVWHERMVP
jgi:hypothetical protein